MKFKKTLLFLITLMMGCGGLLFGCELKPLKLSIIIGETETNTVTLNLSDSTNKTESEESNTENNEDNNPNETDQTNINGEKVNILVKAENSNAIFNKGLDIVVSEKNIINLKLLNTYENAYEYEITALYPKNVVLTFTSKDKKAQVSLNIIVEQDCDKIEKNVQSANFVVLGEDKEISNTILNFTPSTTTNKGVSFHLAENYNGIILENGVIKFTGEQVDVNQIKVNAIHNNYENAEISNQNNFIVEDIVFDILTPINNLVAVKGETPISILEFASNMNLDNLNYAEITIKKSIGNNKVADIDDTYYLEYYLQNNDELVTIDDSKINENILTISQNFRSGTNKLVIKAINKIQPSYQSQLLFVDIVIKTYPTYITVNGSKVVDEIVLYDNGQVKTLDVAVGVDNSFNTNFKVSSVQEEYIYLKYENGLKVNVGESIKSGTKLNLSVVDGLSLKDINKDEIYISFKIEAEGNSSVYSIIKVRIVPNLTDITVRNEEIKYDPVLMQYSFSKTDAQNKKTETTFKLISNEGLYIPTFNIEIEKKSVLSLSKITYSSLEKSFTVIAESSGTTDIKIIFDNGLEKNITLSIYTPVNSIKIDLDSASKNQSIGDIQQNKNYYDKNDVLQNADLYFALKLNSNAQLVINPYDIQNNLINDFCIISTEYICENNDGNIAISNTSNIVTALKETEPNIYLVVTANFNVYTQDGSIQVITKTILISVYINIKSIDIKQNDKSVEYITLYTEDSLGYHDKYLSKTTLVLDIYPLTANNISTPTFQQNFIGAKLKNYDNGELKLVKKDGVYQLDIVAKTLTGGSNSEVGTITFSVQEFNIVYTKKVYVKIVKAQKPTAVLVENISILSDEETLNSINYLYLNLGYDETININPKIYPATSYNLDYVVQIKDSSSEGDPISFNNGIVIAKQAGTCILEIIPKAAIINIDEHGNYIYKTADLDNSNIVKEIMVVVADGLTVPYQIKTKNDLLNLCSTEIISKENISTQKDKYNKKYVLTSDIDLSGTEIYPIGVFKANEGSINTYVENFTGEFSGKLSLNGITHNYSITGISFNIDHSYAFYKKTSGQEEYVGLFAKNSGLIENLNLVYSNISIEATLYNKSTLTTNITNINNNLKSSFYFGGISAINNDNGEITNCTVNIYNSNIVTYFGGNNAENLVGGICGENNNEIIKCSISGNLNIVNGYKIKNLTDKYINLSIGGIAGNNIGLIEGNYEKINSGIFNKSNIDSIANISSLYDGELIYNSDDKTNYGLISGKSSGTIQNATSYGKIYGLHNVGGICGQNSGSILNSLTASCIYGANNVGGLIGDNSGIAQANSVIILDDNEVFIFSSNKAKIMGESYVGGIIGKNSSDILNLTNNYIRSFVNNKEDNYYDIYVNISDFGGIYANDGITDYENYIIGSNFADNLKINVLADITKGFLTDLGIVAPSSITVDINESTLIEDSILGYNKFIKADENTIILFNHKNKDYNYYLQNYLFNVTYNYAENITSAQKIAFNKIESDNNEILSIDSYGNFKVNSAGEVRVKIYSLLDKTKQAVINIKILDEITALCVYKNNDLTSLLDDDKIFIKKDSSINIYLDDIVKQDGIYIKYTLNEVGIIEINTNDSDYYKTLNAQVIKGLESGTVKVTAKLVVKINDNYYELPFVYSFNTIVSVGLNNFYSDTLKATMVANSYVNVNLTVETDLENSTNILFKQFIKNEDNSEDNYLTVINEKQITSGKINYFLKLGVNKDLLNKSLGKTIIFKVYVTDNFVLLNDILANEDEYSKYIKIIEIDIESSTLINVDLEYYASGETVKNELGQDVYNSNELESDFIQIGRIGILKINTYPIENLNKSNQFKLTYTNSDNLNLSFKQVVKSSGGYIDINTDKIISKGIILDNSSLFDSENTNEKYLYVKLLTDSPIKEDSEFNLSLTISGFDYYFTKTLTSKLSSNLEIAYNKAVLNSKGELEGVYAKGVKDSQIISLTVNKLTSFAHTSVILDENNSPMSYASLTLLKTTIISNESIRYDYVVDGLNSNGVAKIYFYLDKTINGKTERYLSKTLKLNIVNFVIESAYLDGTNDNYLAKPIGAEYQFKIKLNTISNGSSDIVNEIKELEDTISKQNIFYYNQELISVKNYGIFEIIKNNGYYFIKPTEVVKNFNFSFDFTYLYNENYSVKFVSKFGINFYLQNDINNPVPVYTQEEFENMQENANYILLNDIVLENYLPLDAKFNSLDGNNFKVIVKSLNINLTANQNEYCFGLFTETSENTTIKNLTVKFNFNYSEEGIVENQNIMNFTNISNFYFGGICAKNNGLIYNCKVENYEFQNSESYLTIQTTNIINDAQTNSYIGTFASVNNGIITNSQSYLKLKVNKGFVAGFVCTNNGTISSCYYKKANIINLGEDEKTSSVAGFVHTNSGDIYYSYVEGEEVLADDKGRSLSDKNLSSFCLTAPTSVGGFVYTNTGNIEDSYSNLSITSNSYSGGFVYTNSGTIKQCYSACYNEKQDNIAHAPFIATKVTINETAMKNLLTNCFYLKSEETSTVNDNLVKGLTFEQFNNEYYLTNFVLGDGLIWEFDKNNIKLPNLVEANKIAVSSRRLYSAKENENGSIIYSYIYTKDYAGSENNPITISSEEEFLNYFATTNSTNDYSYRLINNIDFSEYSNLPTSNYIFSGKLDGNGLKINNMRISAESNFENDSFGLFSKISGENDTIPVIKNLTIRPLEVYANNINNVGTLAGEVNNSKIVNIKVDAKNVIVQGKNVVGGIIGKVTGDSQLINLSSNISANSNYLNCEDGRYLYERDSITNDTNINNKISYSGAVVGVVDVNKSTNNNESVRNIIVYEGTKVLGQISGMAFGLICEESGIDNVIINVNSSSYINATYSAGLVVGENRGYISRAETKYYNITNNENLIKNSSSMAGGIAGFNNNGTIVNSVSRVHISTRGYIAGGIVGVSAGGSFGSNIAYCNITSKNIAGGIIGYATRKTLLNTLRNSEDRIQNCDTTIKENNIVYISSCVANNTVSAQYRGGIIGAIHNTISTTETGASLAIKNSYITHNNYYLKQTYKAYKKDSQGNYLDSENNITTDASKYCEIDKEVQDYGASNCEDFIPQKTTENIESTVKCAEAIESLNLTMFNNFSKNIFDFSSLENIQFKSTNNINTKKIEGQGTLVNPYIVESVSALNELSKINAETNEKIYINLNDNIEATGKEILSIGNSETGFIGKFNGNNYFINGLTYLNKNYNDTENYFGLFGFISEGGEVNNLNIVANFVINYGTSVNYTGIISGYNRGYISKCNVYGGIIAILQNINLTDAVSYVGSVVGANAGKQGYGIVDCNNYARIYVSIKDEENNNESVLNNVIIYAGLIAGTNINGASITRCHNYAIKNIDMNSGAKDYTLVVINGETGDCKNFIGEICGYCDDKSTVYQYEDNTEDNTKVLKSICKTTTIYKGI